MNIWRMPRQRAVALRALWSKIQLKEVHKDEQYSVRSRDISNAIPHLDDAEMMELSLRVIDKLKAMSDEEFAKLDIEAAE